MATLFVKDRPLRSIAPDRYERLLAAASILLIAMVLIALARGAAHWAEVPGVIWLHVATMMIALALTPYMLLRPRGTPMHRLLGKVWVGAMVATAVVSFFVRFSNHGQFSFIHILSVFVLVMAPRVWWTARAHKLVAHRAAVRGLVTGAILIAGFFTLPPFRLLGHWLFG